MLLSIVCVAFDHLAATVDERFSLFSSFAHSVQRICIDTARSSTNSLRIRSILLFFLHFFHPVNITYIWAMIARIRFVGIIYHSFCMFWLPFFPVHFIWLLFTHTAKCGCATKCTQSQCLTVASIVTRNTKSVWRKEEKSERARAT